MSAFAVDRTTGMLKALGQQSSEGPGPAHLSVDRDGRNVLVANYGGGSVVVLPIERDGGLNSGSVLRSAHRAQRQPAAAEGTACALDHTGSLRPVRVRADLGLDQILIYQFDGRKGLLTLNEPPSARVEPGAGPRHFSFHPSGRFGYVINEINCTVTAFTRDPATAEG